MPYNSTQITRGITVLATKIKLSVTPPPPWTAGQSITLVAEVTIDSMPYDGATVLFQWMNADTGWGDIGTAVTDSSGVARLTWTVPWTWTGLTATSTVPCKTNTVRAIERASGVYTSMTGQVAYPTRLSITAPNVVAPGEVFTISGILEYQDTPTTWKGIGANRKITLSYNTTKIIDVYTASDGSYSWNTSIPASGTYTIKAEYAGEGFATAVALLGLTISPEAKTALSVALPIIVGTIAAYVSRRVKHYAI